MKTLFRINLGILVLNFLLYCMPSIGMFFQVLTGMVQIISAGMLTFICIKHKRGWLANLLWLYWLAVGLNILIIVQAAYHNTQFLNLVLFPIPMIIACYFVFITFHFYKESQS